MSVVRPLTSTRAQSQAAAQTVYSFGVDKLLDIEAGEYYRVAEAGRATPLISYMQEPKCTEADQADIDCVWRIPRASQQQGSSVAISAELEERPKPWEPQMVFRFSPGTCDAMSMQDYLSLVGLRASVIPSSPCSCARMRARLWAKRV